MFAHRILFDFLVFSILYAPGAESAEEYGVISRSEILTKINSALEVEGVLGSRGMMNVEDFRWLWKRLMFRDCMKERREKNCNLCTKANSFLQWYRHDETTTISEEKFVQMSLGIIQILTEDGPKGKSCDEFTSWVLGSLTDHVPELLLNKYGVVGSKVNATIVRKIFQDIYKSCGCISRDECFSTSEDIPVTNRYAGTRVEYASLYVIMKLLDTNCLPYEPTGDESAVNTIFKKFQKVYSNAVLKKLDNDTANGSKCYSKTDLKEALSNDRNESIVSQRTINGIAPQFMKMIKNISTGSHSKRSSDGGTQKRTRQSWQPWVASLFSISVISFGSLIGIVAFSGKQRRYFNHVMCFLVSMGSSVLVCDALLHLVPHALDFHGDIEGRHFNADSWLWKCLMILIGVYLFIMLELTLSVFGFDHGHSHSHGDQGAGENHNLLEIKSPNGSIENSLKNKTTLEESTSFTIKSIKSVAWMILVGDGVHNFMDGVAIGGVFAEPFPAGLNGGIMTSIAIFIHEVPHELGDFAVLISSGLTIMQALVLNLLSSLTAFIGGIVGITLGTHWNASPWIFAMTGGLFIYISLVDMLPEVRRNPLLKTSPKLALFLDFCGFMFGLVIMFFLAAYEDRLENALQ